MTGEGQLRELGPQDRDQAWALGVLAFGGDRAAPVEPSPPGVRAWGVFDGERLLAKAALRPYRQGWGGRPVPMGGIAGVAVHPDARGRAMASRLVRELLRQMRAAGQAISVLYPTAPGIYRPSGWELAGALEQTRLPLTALRAAGDPGAVRVRTAGPDDVPAVAELWRGHVAATNGQLTRDGPSFPRGAQGVLEHDVVALAEQDGQPTGYLSYDRGRGYGPETELQVWELVARTASAAAALVRSAASWDAVAGSVLWRGPPAELGLLLRSSLPPVATSRPWMLRVVDAPAAVAARGYDLAVRTQAAFTLVDPEVPEHAGPWLLTVADGAGRLERAGEGPPRLHVRGLSAMFAGSMDSRAAQRSGLLEAPVAGLDAFAGPAPQLLDYF